MIDTPDIPKGFILDKAIQDATNILLKPYRPVTVTESCTNWDNYETNYEIINQIKEKCISHSHDFLLKVSTTAWDFLNVLSMFQSNLAIPSKEKDILEDDI